MNGLEEVHDDLVGHEPSVICDPEGNSPVTKGCLGSKLFEGLNCPWSNKRLLKGEWGPALDAEVKTVPIYRS